MNESRVPGRMRRALLACACAALCLAGFTSGRAVAQAAVPGGAVEATPGRLSDEQLGRLQRIALDKGSSIPVPAPLASALDLRSAQVGPAVRQVSFQSDDGVKHGYARLNDGSGHFLFRKSAAGLSVFHVDAAFKLVAAAHDFGGERFIALAAQEGQDQLDGEVAAWSRVLVPRVAPLPLPSPLPPGTPGVATPAR
jgi:hypothetical protein